MQSCGVQSQRTHVQHNYTQGSANRAEKEGKIAGAGGHHRVCCKLCLPAVSEATPTKIHSHDCLNVSWTETTTCLCGWGKPARNQTCTKNSRNAETFIGFPTKEPTNWLSNTLHNSGKPPLLRQWGSIVLAKESANLSEGSLITPVLGNPTPFGTCRQLHAFMISNRDLGWGIFIVYFYTPWFSKIIQSRHWHSCGPGFYISYFCLRNVSYPFAYEFFVCLFLCFVVVFVCLLFLLLFFIFCFCCCFLLSVASLQSAMELGDLENFWISESNSIYLH